MSVSPEVIASFKQAMETGVIPDFEGKDSYIVWSSSWNRTGFSDSPQYPGQLPERYPPEWPPLYCHLMSNCTQ